jgi:hypothetical protein
MKERLSGNAKKDDPEKENLRPIRVRTVRDARRLLARIMKQLQLEEISESRAKTISYVANSYAKLYEVSELEERVTELEKLTANK